MRPEGKKTRQENAEIDYEIRATKADVALQQFANCLCEGRFEEACEWMELARKILREHNGYDAFVHSRVSDPVGYVFSREHVPNRRDGVVVLNRVLQIQLKSDLSDGKREVPICA